MDGSDIQYLGFESGILGRTKLVAEVLTGDIRTKDGAFYLLEDGKCRELSLSEITFIIMETLQTTLLQHCSEQYLERSYIGLQEAKDILFLVTHKLRQS